MDCPLLLCVIRVEVGHLQRVQRESTLIKRQQLDNVVTGHPSRTDQSDAH